MEEKKTIEIKNIQRVKTQIIFIMALPSITMMGYTLKFQKIAKDM